MSPESNDAVPPRRPWIPPETELEARRLHARVVAGDPTAGSRLCELVLTLVMMGVRRKFGRAADDEIQTAAHDALLSYLADPAIYNPEKGGLISFMVMAARRDLQNANDKEGRYQGRYPLMPQVVADDGSESEVVVEFADVRDTLVATLINLRNGELDANLQAILPDPADWNILLLMVNGVREHELYALEMGIEELPIEEQTKIVKRAKDRIRARCIRHRDEVLKEVQQSSHD